MSAAYWKLSAIWLGLQKRLQEQEGQGMVEYALILVLIAIVVIIALTFLGSRIADVFNQITSGLGT